MIGYCKWSKLEGLGVRIAVDSIMCTCAPSHSLLRGDHIEDYWLRAPELLPEVLACVSCQLYPHWQLPVINCMSISLPSVDFLVIAVSLITLALETDPNYAFLVVVRPIKLVRYCTTYMIHFLLVTLLSLWGKPEQAAKC